MARAASKFDLRLLHATARCRRAFVRGQEGTSAFVRKVRRERRGFSRPPRTAARQTNSGSGVDGALMLALPYRDDIDLPEGNSAYAVFLERNTPSLTASDLFS